MFRLSKRSSSVPGARETTTVRGEMNAHVGHSSGGNNYKITKAIISNDDMSHHGWQSMSCGAYIPTESRGITH